MGGGASNRCWRVPNGKRVVSTERLNESQRQPNPFYNFVEDLASVYVCVFIAKESPLLFLASECLTNVPQLDNNIGKDFPFNLEAWTLYTAKCWAFPSYTFQSYFSLQLVVSTKWAFLKMPSLLPLTRAIKCTPPKHIFIGSKECGGMELLFFLIKRRGFHIILAHLHGFLWNLFSATLAFSVGGISAEEIPISVPPQQSSPYQLWNTNLMDTQTPGSNIKYDVKKFMLNVRFSRRSNLSF